MSFKEKRAYRMMYFSMFESKWKIVEMKDFAELEL